MDIDQRFEQLERPPKRLRIAVVVLATALCGVVSMAAPEWSMVEAKTGFGDFETVKEKTILLYNDEKNTGDRGE